MVGEGAGSVNGFFPPGHHEPGKAGIFLARVKRATVIQIFICSGVGPTSIVRSHLLLRGNIQIRTLSAQVRVSSTTHVVSGRGIKTLETDLYSAVRYTAISIIFEIFTISEFKAGLRRFIIAHKLTPIHCLIYLTSF